MKTNSSFLHHSALAALTAYLLLAASPTTEAQTYNGQLKLTDAPTQLETNVYPVTNRPATIRVIFNNRTAGTVRVVIRDEQGKIRYEDCESIALYRRTFDLSELPAGNYTVELSKKNEHVTRTFAIKTPPPATSWITMDAPAMQTIPDLSKPKGNVLSVNQ